MAKEDNSSTTADADNSNEGSNRERIAPVETKKYNNSGGKRGGARREGVLMRRGAVLELGNEGN
jgi:hypothetical protein